MHWVLAWPPIVCSTAGKSGTVCISVSKTVIYVKVQRGIKSCHDFKKKSQRKTYEHTHTKHQANRKYSISEYHRLGFWYSSKATRITVPVTLASLEPKAGPGAQQVLTTLYEQGASPQGKSNCHEFFLCLPKFVTPKLETQTKHTVSRRLEWSPWPIVEWLDQK